MNDVAALPALLPALPEIVLAVGAMVLLMLGAFRGEHTAVAVNWLAIVLLVAAGVITPVAAWRHAGDLRGQLHRRSVRAFSQAARADRLGRPRSSCRSTIGGRKAAEVRIPDPDPAIDHRHADAHLGGRSHCALSRPRIDESCALRGRGDQSRFHPLVGSRAQYFILGALSSGMLLYGASLVYGFTGTVTFTGIAKAASPDSIGLILAWSSCSRCFCFKVSAVPFPHVDAGRL